MFNEFIRDGRATQYPKGAFYGGTYSMTDLWNASFLFNVDAALFSHIGKLDVFFPWITDVWLLVHDTEGKCLSWITGEQTGWRNSFPCDYTGTLQAHTEAHTACLTGVIALS